MRDSTRRTCLWLGLLGSGFFGAMVPGGSARAAEFRRLPVREYVDKMEAGWLGQMAGVAIGGPTEFKWRGEIIPADRVPKWRPEMINQFHQDDLYVEMTFLRTLEVHGFDARSTPSPG